MYIKECPYYADGYANEKQKDVQLEGILLVMVWIVLTHIISDAGNNNNNNSKHIVQHTK